MTTPPVDDGRPRWDEGKRIWVSGYFVVRGSLDIRDLVCVSPRSGGVVWGTVLQGGNLGYRGDLIAVAIPKGSEWLLALSDAPLTQREIEERAKALHRKALEDHISAIWKGAKSNAQRADAVLRAAQR